MNANGVVILNERTPINLNAVSEYYSATLAKHGPVAQGADWNGEEGQVLRFAQIAKLLPTEASFSINDLGCGYGALFEYLYPRFQVSQYTGIDISNSMLDAARAKFSGNGRAEFELGSRPAKIADFSVCSGIFNVLMGHSVDDWKSYVLSTIDSLSDSSRGGFAFNCLTSWSDRDKMRADLFYADPCELFEHCKRRYSRHVALLHDYGLYEFTILVRKLI